MTKFCIDCKFHKFEPYNPHNAICTKQGFNDVVTGQMVNLTCREVRADITMCGKNADWFEAKDNVAAA